MVMVEEESGKLTLRRFNHGSQGTPGPRLRQMLPLDSSLKISRPSAVPMCITKTSLVIVRIRTVLAPLEHCTRTRQARGPGPGRHALRLVVVGVVLPTYVLLACIAPEVYDPLSSCLSQPGPRGLVAHRY